MQSGTKNPPWARSAVNTNMNAMNTQMMDPNAMAMTQQGMMPFQQTQAVFNPNMMQAQGGMAMPMAGQMQLNPMAQGQMYPGNVVAYPTPRSMNPNVYQNPQAAQGQAATPEQRVFTGTVTKTHNDFGFVDHDVFYQSSVCSKGMIPKVNDRVLVEASYNANMPFKWNATRVQVLPQNKPQNKPQHKPLNKPQPMKVGSGYNAVPPPGPNDARSRFRKPMQNRQDDRPARREDRKRSRSRSKSPIKPRRRDSPPKKRSVPPPSKYVCRVPRIPLDLQESDVTSLTQRYSYLYIPSHFFSAQIRWSESFPPQYPFSLNNPCAYHIMSKDAPNPLPSDDLLEPPDADYSFSAKVMLISMPTLESLYQKCALTRGDDKDKRSTPKAPIHPTRLIKFLVGHKGKGAENFAIGGPWCPSLDGENPEKDPGVLVKTAIRTCKALTGIDLSSCTQWYRMVEFYYWREGAAEQKSRLECVVLFLPDVWSALPSRLEWSATQDLYKGAREAAIKNLQGEPVPEEMPKLTPEKPEIENADPANESTITLAEDEGEGGKEPTHYSKIDLRTIKVDQLREELDARGVSSKGLRAQLIARLSKCLKAEERKDKSPDDTMDVEENEVDKTDGQNETEEPEKQTEEKSEEDSVKPDDKKKDEKQIKEEKEKLVKDISSVRANYEIPNSPHIIVHPSPTARGGKFNCTVATLSLLLDYRITDNKEHSFELFLFAELFNEMLMRDLGFYIYKTLYTLPEKLDVKDDREKDSHKKDDKKGQSEKKDDKSEKKDEKVDKKDEKSEKKEEKLDKKDEKTDKKDEKKDDNRKDRHRERRESISDVESDKRSGSPKRRSNGVELPPDPYLLLALVYFDTGRFGYIMRRDLQALFMALGLSLSRSQVKVILDKVCIKQVFSYKSLVQQIKDLSSGSTAALQDLPLDSTAAPAVVPSHVAELEATIAAGNRDLLPVFDDPNDSVKSSDGTNEISESGMVMYKKRLVDVGATLMALERSESRRLRLEEALVEARSVARSARAAALQQQGASSRAHSQLQELQTRLQASRTRVSSLTASSKIFHSALKSIQAKTEAVVNIKFEDDDDVVEVINGPSKSESKAEELKEVKNEAGIEVSKEDIKTLDEVITNATLSIDDDGSADVLNSENMEIDDKE